MATGRHRFRLSPRQRIAALAAAAAILISVPFAVLLGTGAPARAAGTYDNAAIADKALSYINRPIGQACREAGNDRSDGECRSFVNCIIWMVSGHTQNPASGWPNYFTGFAKYGQQITDVNQLMKGDVVQQGGDESARLHTYIIVGRVTGNTFNVVDSNSDRTHRVFGGPGHNRTVVLSSAVRAYRLGTVRGGSSSGGGGGGGTITKPGPVFPVMNTSETLPDGVWFRDNPNLSGPRLNGYGVYKGDQVRLECYGTGAPIGAYANHVWYRATNLTRPNAPGRANVGWLNAHYINDGKATNVVDPGVPVC